ncbi:trans-sialidase, putative, partial [Trypanosoma cruzi marinkellei]
KEGEQSGKINWSGPVSLLKQITDGSQSDAKAFYPGGGTGVLMEDGTLVLPVQGENDNEPIPMIIYSTDDGNSWDVSKGTPPAKCLNIRITEWEKGQILMVLQCENGQRVFESRDMGRNWMEALGTLSGVWVNPHSNIPLVEILRIGALITATIEERRVMLYVQKKFPSEENANALYLWITDNNRTFHVGPLFVENDETKTFSNSLLYSDGALHFLYDNGKESNRSVSLARLT